MIRKESEDVLNMLLVKLFNDILKIEAAAIKQGEFSDLSVTENHIIEAIGKDREMTMTEVAKDLEITVGTLTTAINRLIKKEYVERRRIEEDRRVVLIKLTNVSLHICVIFIISSSVSKHVSIISFKTLAPIESLTSSISFLI